MGLFGLGSKKSEDKDKTSEMDDAMLAATMPVDGSGAGSANASGAPGVRVNAGDNQSQVDAVAQQLEQGDQGNVTELKPQLNDSGVSDAATSPTSPSPMQDNPQASTQANGLPSLDGSNQPTNAPAAPQAQTPEPAKPDQSSSNSAALPDLNAQQQVFGSADNGSSNAQKASNVSGEANLLTALVKKGKLDEAKAKELQQEVVTTGITIEQALEQKGLVDVDTIYRIKAEMHGVEFVELRGLDIPADVLQKLPQSAARKYTAVPVEQLSAGLKVAMSDPLDIQTVKFVGAVAKSNIVPVYSSPPQINYVIDNKYSAQVGDEVEAALANVGDQTTNLSGAASEVTDLTGSGIQNAPVSKIVNMILEYAIRYDASDVHIEPREEKIAIRFRIFGVLSEKLTLPKKLLPSVVSRIKILANLKIDEHRVPQDGRFQVKLGDKVVDLRVSIVPAVYGEKIVMRLLKKGGGTMTLADTGMRGHSFKAFNDGLEKTQGIILVTGPTGSGKTQTLASSLKKLNKEGVNIMTLEDPVEIRIDGINQIQVNAEVGLTFATGLRSFLRQDPDIIMVGEIRDSETANLAVQAALTGHLVLATLHTNSAAGAIPRLLDMGVEPFLLASTLNVVLAQRLVRRIDDKVREAYYADQEVLEQIHRILDGIQYNVFELPNNDQGNPQDPMDDKIALYRGTDKNGTSGYSGRVGIFEALQVTEDISKLILKQASTTEIKKQAVANGMVTMLQDGFIKALEGHTTVEEVLRVQTV